MEIVELQSAYERERGKPMPSKVHGITQIRLGAAMAPWFDQYTVIGELALDLGGRPLTPDLCVYPRLEIDYTDDEIRMTEPPLLAVEIVSPTQGVQELLDKIRHMLQHGVQSCWLVLPAIQAVTVFTADMKQTTFTEGEIADPTVAMKICIEDIFPDA